MTDRPANAEQNARADEENLTAWLPDLVYTGGGFKSGLAVVCDAAGRIARISSDTNDIADVVRLENQALLPGMVNAHSHAFQRVIRGRTEWRRSDAGRDDFWTWREMMYRAANSLSPEDVYDASRMAFLEMSLTGITAVGEFHYLHRTPEGAAYDDQNLLSKEVVRAARDVGLRIALLRTAYARSGFQKAPHIDQRRFIESEPDVFIGNVEALRRYLQREYASGEAWAGVAPHSTRAVPLEYLREVSDYAAAHDLKIHIHVAEQPAEIDACIAEHGRAPVALLDYEGLLNERFTGVHAIHISPAEAEAMSHARAIVCACPTTERNLGDGIVQADMLISPGVGSHASLAVALGTDSHTQIDLLEDARELEYHLRLQRLERTVLPAHLDDLHLPLLERGARLDSSERGTLDGLAATLFACATVNGAHSIGAPGGKIEAGAAADFFTVDLDDPSIAGASAEDLLPAIVFSLSRTAVRAVVVAGRAVVHDGRHAAQAEIVERFRRLQRKLWR